MKSKILEAMRDDKQLYTSRKENGLCVRCGCTLIEADLTKTDRIRCSACRSHINHEYKHGTAIEARRRAAGLCINCGKILIGTERMFTACEECMDKARARREKKKKDTGNYGEIRKASESLEETCKWLKRLAKGIAADGMHIQCEDCPWLRRRTGQEKNSYCPTASGTSPDTMDCLKYTAVTVRENRKGTINEFGKPDREHSTGSGAEKNEQRP